jgi:hypothetical protein
VSKGELILYFANIQFFLQLFEICEVSISEWVAQKVNFVQPPHPSRSQTFLVIVKIISHRL